MTSRTLLAGSLLVLGLAAFPDRARACSVILCPELHSTPPDGATSVPLNVELEALGDDFHLLGPITLELRVAGTTESVPLEAANTPGRMRATGGLIPSTQYELRGPSLPTSCAASATVVLATFTTGDADDTTPPSTPTTTSGGCAVAFCNSGACCGAYVAATSMGSWSATDEDGLAVVYAFGAPSGPRLARGGGTWVDLVVGTSSSATVTFEPIPNGDMVFAIDAAGNVSSGATFDPPDFSCAPTAEEAAAYFACDGGSCADAAGADAGTTLDAAATFDAGAPPASSSGCHVGSRASRSVLGLALFILAGAVLRRSRLGAHVRR